MELDKDLAARQEARALARQAEKAQHLLADFPQEKLDAIVEAVARAFSAEATSLAELAVQETGFGNVTDKTTKNKFASETVAKAVRGMKTVGLLRKKAEEHLWEIGVPVGVIAAIVPSTNPTSTVCYKAMIALKAGNPILFSPHPKAVNCTRRAARIVAQAAESAGAPVGSVGCLSIPSMAGCNYFMGIPHGDDIMLNYQTTGFRETAALRELTGKTAIPEFQHWLEKMGFVENGKLTKKAGDGSSLLF